MKKNKPYFIFKRTFDILISLLVIIILSWFYLIVAILVAISSRGNPFFKDKRVGKNGKTIYVYKFRSMYSDAESNIEKYLTKEQIEHWEKERNIENDPRVTKLGKIIRKTSIDEFPQFFNIIAGSLSLVGPRPVTQVEIDKNYTKEEAELLLSVKPGLLSYWAVNGRNNIDYASKKRQAIELEYVKNQSLKLDIKIMFKSIACVISTKGAN